MPHEKYRVTLTEAERNQLHDIIDRGKHGAQERKRAQALLLANEEYTDEIIAERSRMHRRGIEALRKRFVEDGFEATPEGKSRGQRPCSIRGEEEARLVALVCGPVPEGSARWTLRLLEDAWVTLENTDTKRVSRETIRRTLKETNLNPGKTGSGVYRRKETLSLQPEWKMYWMFTRRNRTKSVRWCAWTSVRSSL